MVRESERGKGGGKGKREREESRVQNGSGDITRFTQGLVFLRAKEMVINPQSQLTKFSGSPLCLLGSCCYLKLLCVDSMLFHQLLALVLMQVKMAYLHCAAGSGQLDEGKRGTLLRKIVFGFKKSVWLCAHSHTFPN